MRNILLLTVLALFLAPLFVNAQYLTPEQQITRMQFDNCAVCDFGSTVPDGPTFFVNSSVKTVTPKGQVRAFEVATGSFIRRQAGSETYYFPAGTVVVNDGVDYPEETEVVYTILQAGKAQFHRTFINRIPASASLGYFVSDLVVSQEVVYCDTDRVCTWKPTKSAGAKRFVVQAYGLFPEDVWILPVASDGTVGKPVQPVVSEDRTSLTAEIGRFTDNRTLVRLVVWYSGVRTTETVDGWLNSFNRPEGNPPRDGRPQ